MPVEVDVHTVCVVLQMAISASSGHVNKPVGRLNLKNSCNPNTFHAPLWLFLPQQIVVFSLL